MDLGSDQVCIRTDITYRQLDWWIRQGYVRERARRGSSGIARSFSDHEVRVIRRMAALVRIGITPSSAAKMARQMVDQGIDEITVGGADMEARIALSSPESDSAPRTS